MLKLFFIMLYSQNGTKVFPIIDENDDPMLYESEEEAEEAMSGHPYAEAFGYEIFELGTGTIR